jgi:hypothetical protein
MKLVLFAMDGDKVIETKSREAGLNNGYNAIQATKRAQQVKVQEQDKAALEARRTATRLAQAAVGTSGSWQPRKVK